jgi:hypothetical protein
MTNIAQSFPDNSKVTVYAASRELDATEVNWLLEQCNVFTSEWNAHGTALKATIELLHNRFLCVIVDETSALPSGCSIDSNVRFIKTIGKELNVDFFNRLKIWVEKDGLIQQVHFNDLISLPNETKCYDTLVNKLIDLRINWPITLKESSYCN